jgi:phosphoenolpyruvate carboxylase
MASPAPEFSSAMHMLAAHSFEAYRRLVFVDPEFFRYFSAATPVDVIERMHIAARPAKRAHGTEIESLRAIPWVFAWTQSRHMLPGWYGFGSGLQPALEEFGDKVFARMLQQWPFFGHLLDDVEAMLARTDLEIAQCYDALAEGDLGKFADPIRKEYLLTVSLVQRLRGSSQLLDGDPTLRRSIMLRNPYVDPMHLMQVDLLKRWRATGRRDEALFSALRATISGIAQGLQATG